MLGPFLTLLRHAVVDCGGVHPRCAVVVENYAAEANQAAQPDGAGIQESGIGIGIHDDAGWVGEMWRRSEAGVILQDRKQIVGRESDGVDGEAVFVGHRGDGAVQRLGQQVYGDSSMIERLSGTPEEVTSTFWPCRKFALVKVAGNGRFATLVSSPETWKTVLLRW